MDRQTIQTLMKNIGIDCEVLSSQDLLSDPGCLVNVDIEGYGPAEFYIPTSFDMSGVINHSGMPLEYMSKTGDDFKFDIYGEDVSAIKPIVNAAIMNYLDFSKSGEGLYIYSTTKGSGKTMLACVIANEVLKRHQITCKFISIPDYIEMHRERNPELDRIKNASLLIVDDFGVQDESKDWINEIIYGLVDWRYRNLGVTIYTSNKGFSEKEISKEDRIASRVYSRSVPIKLPSVSIRARKADQYRDKFLREVLGNF